MKILMFLTNPFVSDSRVFNEAKALLQVGHEVSLIAWDRSGKQKSYEIKDGIRVYRIHNNFFMRILHKYLLQMPIFWFKAIVSRI